MRPKVAAPPTEQSLLTNRSLLTKSHNDLPESFGRYRVKQKLGEGAMGAVYLAEDSLLQRDVALKTPTFEDDDDGELLKRFYREARAVSKLKHHNLCGVYDVGEIDGRHYISMEFVPGKKLQEFIKPDKPMTEKQAMAVVRKIALGMQEAHAHGVIHRDLKPDNIMINEKGEPVVMDFGLVHKTDQQNSTRLTQRGTLVGSPAYMSKEQVEGDPDKLTNATDQYSLGVILYQLLTSKLPFEGNIHAVLGAILTKEPPPPSEHRPDINPHLEVICLKMMAKEAQDRYPSMKAAADALAEVAKRISKAAGSVAAPAPIARSLTGGLTATFTEIPCPPEQALASPLDSPPNTSPLQRLIAKQPKPILYGSFAAGMALLLAVILWFHSSAALV
ncbi:MAG: serine/threonine protein kinase, partial [Candidatus Saccharimonas sp.]|nr:serine/threonine protein kinase [Planctomycetaceae bacterium]